jgi:hypothetical protein
MLDSGDVDTFRFLPASTQSGIKLFDAAPAGRYNSHAVNSHLFVPSVG